MEQQGYILKLLVNLSYKNNNLKMSLDIQNLWLWEPHISSTTTIKT
jgi:hypothetical protein